MRILVVDNYDSFVFNLVQYLGQLGVEADVWRNDDGRLSDVAAVAEQFDGVLLSPGPGTPERAGASIALVRACAAARTRSGVIMGVRHTDLPIHGVQFHPESILTEGGHRMLANWLAYCGWTRNDTLVRRLENEVRAAVRPYLPTDPAATDRTSA